jgi:hypothetical protein
VICDFTAIDFPVFVCVILILISGDNGKISGCRESGRTMRDVVSRQYKGGEASYDYGKVRVSWTKYHSIVYNNLLVFEQKLSQSDTQIQLRPTRRQGTGGSSKGERVYGL